VQHVSGFFLPVTVATIFVLNILPLFYPNSKPEHLQIYFVHGD